MGWLDAETITEVHSFRRPRARETPKSTDSRRGQSRSGITNASRRMPMSSASSFNDPAGRQLLAMLSDARRNKFGDPKYHSGRKKKEFASPYLEFLDKLEKLARKMPQPYEFDLLHADGIRHADLDAGKRVLNELIYECQRSLEAIGHAELDLDAQANARAQGYGRP
jgi:hypothetical protein